MNLELDPEEERALVAELRRLIRDDRYPLTRRIRTLRGILDKLEPPAVREPLAAEGVCAAARQAEPAPRPPVNRMPSVLLSILFCSMRAPPVKPEIT